MFFCCCSINTLLLFLQSSITVQLSTMKNRMFSVESILEHFFPLFVSLTCLLSLSSAMFYFDIIFKVICRFGKKRKQFFLKITGTAIWCLGFWSTLTLDLDRDECFFRDQVVYLNWKSFFFWWFNSIYADFVKQTGEFSFLLVLSVG